MVLWSSNLHLQSCREGARAAGLGSHLSRPGCNHRVRRNQPYCRRADLESVAPMPKCPRVSSGILDDNKRWWCRQELWRSILLPPRTVRPKTESKTGAGCIEEIRSFSFDSPPFFLGSFTSCSVAYALAVPRLLPTCLVKNSLLFFRVFSVLG